MADIVIVQPNGPDQVVGLHRHQNSLINVPLDDGNGPGIEP
ncbi:hypothetical protein MTBBW1_1860029 [Desulfamplus magnetovallimortis]|uniref:Uncharacterized protein n=1 Tax=Desulfamplus magnetovallimortis TaxID=1246637 RepID=A0A1W1HAS9_9BACT|nr:hypothetical protein MTBBW1_1860029 [Desulfamplus magnetovallimortis]